MKKYPVIALFAFFPFLLFPQTAPDTTQIVLELKDGSRLIGTVQSEDSLSLRFLTPSGASVAVPQISIRYKYPAERVSQRTDSLSVGPVADPSSSRLFFMPTGRPIGGGRGYFSTYELFFPSFGFGIGNLLSLSGGMSMLPGVHDQVYYVAPKVTFYQTPYLALAVGGMSFGSSGGAQTDLYAVGTFGNEKAALTVAAHVPTDPMERSNLVVGGEVRTSARIKLITENWIFDQSILYSFGIRFFSERLAADLAFFRSSATSSSDGFPFFPWLGFSYTFGNSEPVTVDEPKTKDRTPSQWKLRVSYSLVSPRSADRSIDVLAAQGFTMNDYNDGILSFGDSPTTGSGLLLQGERRIAGPWSVGISVVTLGELLGTGPHYQTYYSRYNGYYSYSVGTEVKRHSSSGFAHVSWTAGGEQERSPQYTVGGGIGRSTITQEWAPTYYSSSLETISHSYSEWSGLLFVILEQHITGAFSIGIDAAYVLMPDTKTDPFTLTRVTVTDYSVNPAVQQQIPVNIPSASMNFGYGRIGLGVSAGF